MAKETITLKISEEQKERIIYFYNDYKKENNGDYIVFFATYEGINITIYESKKGFKVTFIGEDALKEAKIWDINAEANKEKPNDPKMEWLSMNTQIGSDEVGVGDLFLPMVVVAAFIKKEQIEELKRLGIDDSKRLTDRFIMEIGPVLVKKFEFSKLTLHNKKYNEMIDRGENLNSLKARLHNRALMNLKKKHKSVKEIYVDEFCSREKYFQYLMSDKEVLTGITFKQKGESYYPSVALASVIARYSFLLEKKKLEEKYQLKFPFGAGKTADEFINIFAEKYGLDELVKLAKKNFSNLRKVLGIF